MDTTKTNTLDTSAMPSTPEPVVLTPPSAPEPVVPTQVSSTPTVSDAPKQMSIADEIAAHNAALEAEDAIPVEETSPAENEAPAEDEASAVEDEAVIEPIAPEVETAPSVVFDAADDFAAFDKKKEEYLQTVEITPELQTILDRYETELASARVAADSGTSEMQTALNALFDVEESVNGQITPNARPLVDLLKKDYRNEYTSIAEEVLGSDSTKYQGASIFEELLIDTYGQQKAKAVSAYLQANAELPAVSEAAMPPSLIGEKNKDAYAALPQSKRDSLNKLANEVADLRNDLMASSEYDRPLIEEDLRLKQAELSGELQLLSDSQAMIEMRINAKATAERQQAEASARFNESVFTESTSDIQAMADEFIKELAPALTFADADTQVSHARNIVTRISNALGYFVDGNGNMVEDPFADHYANQLKEEGVQFDFKKGRQLLQDLYSANRKLRLLETTQNASPRAVELAKQAKKNVLFKIKAEEKALLGQITAKYVRSANTAQSKKIDAVRGKKSAVRALPQGGQSAPGNRRPSVEQEIAEWNRRVAARTGDDLYDSYQR